MRWNLTGKINIINNYFKNVFLYFFIFILLQYNFCNVFATPKTEAPKTNLSYKINGLTGPVLQNVQLRLDEKLKRYNYVNHNQALHFYRIAQAQIKKGMQPYGYFRPKISGGLFRQKGQWIVIYNIQKGIPLHITSVSLLIEGEGSNDPKILKVSQNLSLKKGDVFDVPVYNNAKKDLFQTAKDEGYLRAYFADKIYIDLKKYTCVMQIKLVTGQQYYFGRFLFLNYPYRVDFLKRFISIHEGEVFSSARLIKLQQAMERSYYFKQVIFRPDFTDAHDKEIPVQTYLYPPKLYKYTFGIGYGTLSGPRVSGSMSLRHLTDTGHHLEADMKWSRIIGGLSVNYYIPGARPLNEEWLIGANIKKFIPKTGESQSLTFMGGYSYHTEKFNTSANLNFLIERFYVLRKLYRYSHLLYPNWKISYIDVDSITDPHNGIDVSFNLQAAAQQLLSTTSFGQACAKAKLIFSPFGKSRFILRSELGYTTVHNLKNFPLSLRFFAGGIDSIRGFVQTSIGPGRYLEIASIEYQQALWSSFYAAAFYDIGTAANHFDQPISRGAGVGIVYESRIGPIRVYLAQALSKHTKPRSVEISIGPELT